MIALRIRKNGKKHFWEKNLWEFYCALLQPTCKKQSLQHFHH